MRARLLLLVKAGISVGILAWLVFHLNGPAIVAAFLRLDPFAFVLALAIIFAQYSIGAYRWRLIAAAAGSILPFRQALRLIAMGQFFGQLLPSSVGGDAVRAFGAGRQGLGLARAAATVLMDRGLGFLALLVMIFATAPLASPHLPTGAAQVLVYVVPLAGLAGAVLCLVLSGPMSRFLERWPRLEPFGRIARDISGLLRSGGRGIAAFALSFGIHALTALSLLVLSHGLGLNIAYLDLLIFVPPVILIMALPISIAGWGVREGAMVVGLGLVGVAPAEALALSILWALAILAASSTGAAAWLFRPRPEQQPMGADG